MDGPPAASGSPELDLRKLRYFVAVAEDLHFGRAAERLFVAQPALSRQISQLEQSLGVALFTRTSRHVELTDAGHQLLEDAVPLLAAAGTARSRAIRAAQTRHTLAVGFFIGDATVTRAIRTFEIGHPDVAVEVRRIYWSDQTTVLLDGSVDVAIVHLPIDDRGLRVQRLHTEPRVAVLPADHPLAGRQRVSITELRDDPVIQHEGAAPAWEAFHNFDPRPDGRAARPGPVVTCIEEKLEQIAAGRAISFLPRSAAALIPLQPGVVAVEMTDMPPTEVCVAWNAERETPLVLAFAAAVQESAPSAKS
jgi:DNA-binding transcriptional LysR family regulator